MTTNKQTPTPNDIVMRMAGYSVPRPGIPVDLNLDSNEGIAPDIEILEYLKETKDTIFNRYPKDKDLTETYANHVGVDPEQVIICAGGDDVIDRACKTYVTAGKNIVVTDPTFEMFSYFAGLCGGETKKVAWPKGEFPVDDFISAMDENTKIAVIVSPNNPTGEVTDFDTIAKISKAVPNVLLMVDFAYIEFADNDFTLDLLRLPNVLIVRTMSKAWGMAGVRMGFGLSTPEIINYMRLAGGPFPVSSLALAISKARIENQKDKMLEYVSNVKSERQELAALLKKLGADPMPTQANFVTCAFKNADWVRSALSGLGIAIRGFPGRDGLDDKLRITCPGNSDDFERLKNAFEIILNPEAILFDMDGVLADVSESYRQTIIETVKHFGVTISDRDVEKEKMKGEANNDWILSQRLLANNGVIAELAEVKDVFENIYQGASDKAGLREKETLIVDRTFLSELSQKYKLAVVTGRPKMDMDRFLDRMELRGFFSAFVCMGEASAKPDPAPVLLAMERLELGRAWMLGDTPDDIVSARSAGVLPLGVFAPGDKKEEVNTALNLSGAAKVLNDLNEIKELLP